MTKSSLTDSNLSLHNTMPPVIAPLSIVHSCLPVAMQGCSGAACFRYIFLTEAVCCLIATVLCLFLKLRIMDRFNVTSLAEVFQRL
jgi:hypothetical protein